MLTVIHLVPAGLSRPLLESEDEVAAGNHVGTIMYSAPEIFATSRLTKPGDVYAFGIMRETGRSSLPCRAMPQLGHKRKPLAVSPCKINLCRHMRNWYRTLSAAACCERAAHINLGPSISTDCSLTMYQWRELWLFATEAFVAHARTPPALPPPRFGPASPCSSDCALAMQCGRCSTVRRPMKG